MTSSAIKKNATAQLAVVNNVTNQSLSNIKKNSTVTIDQSKQVNSTFDPFKTGNQTNNTRQVAGKNKSDDSDNLYSKKEAERQIKKKENATKVEAKPETTEKHSVKKSDEKPIAKKEEKPVEKKVDENLSMGKNLS